MAIERHLGQGVFPDVTLHGGAVVVAWQHGAGVYLVTLDPLTLQERTYTALEIGPNAGAFCRLLSWEGRLWLSYREGEPQERLWVKEIGGSAQFSLGRGHGNDPVALGHGDVVWQSQGAPGWEVRRRPLVGTGERFVRNGAPTGLSRVLPGDGVTLVDEDRGAVPGYTRPCWSGDLVTVEYHWTGNVGVLGRLDDGTALVLWPSDESFTPRCVLDADVAYVVTWGGPGVRIARVERAEFVEPKPVDVPFAVDPAGVIPDILPWLQAAASANQNGVLWFHKSSERPDWGEWWSFDSTLIGHLEDASTGLRLPGGALDGYYFLGNRPWLPRRCATGWSLSAAPEIVWRHGQREWFPYSLRVEVGRGVIAGREVRVRQYYDPRRPDSTNPRRKAGYLEVNHYGPSGPITHEVWQDDAAGTPQRLSSVPWPILPGPFVTPQRPQPYGPIWTTPVPQRTNMTITEPALNQFPIVAPGGRLRLVAGPDGGGYPAWIAWRYRRVGESQWTQQDDRRDPRRDADHTMRLPGPGEYEVSLAWDGGETGARRVVRVEGSVEPPPPPPPPPPTPGGPMRYPLIADKTVPSTWELLTVEQHGANIALRAASGAYVSALKGGGGDVRVDRRKVEHWEQFVLERHGEHVAFRTLNGFYLSAIDGGGHGVNAKVKAVGTWERFKPSVPPVNGAGVWFQCWDGKHYLCADRGGAPEGYDPDKVPEVGTAIGYLPPAGLVRMAGWSMADDHGPRPMLSATLMDAQTQLRRDPGRLDRNIAYCRTHGVDFVRILGACGWPGVEEMRPDAGHLANTVRFIWERGMRTQLCLFGGMHDYGFMDGSRRPTEAARQWVHQACGAIKNAGLEVAIALVDVINEPGHNAIGPIAPGDIVPLAQIVRQYFGQVPLSFGAPYGRNSQTGWGEDEKDAYRRFCVSPATVATPHYDRGTNGEEGDYRACRQPYLGAMMGFPCGNDEHLGPGSSVRELRDPTMQRVLASGTWLQKNCFHCWHTKAGVGLNTDSPLEAEPGLPGLSAVRAILPRDIAGFELHNWHWGTNPVETMNGVRAGNPRGVVRTHGLISGDRVVIHLLGVDFGADLRARRGMHLVQHSWNGTQYVPTAEHRVSSGQRFQVPGAPDQILVGRFV